MTDITLTSGSGLLPKNLNEAMQLAEILSTSSIVPKDYQGNPGNVLVAVQWGAEIGLAPMQAMQNIAVINGRPSLWGDAMLALVRGSGKLEYINEEITDSYVTCTVKRINEPETSRTFGLDDAKKAGLLSKGPWTQYPKRMMQMRARAFALRDVFTDVLKGMASADEEQDKVKDMGKADEIVQDKPAKQSRADKAKAAVKAIEQQPEPEQIPAITIRAEQLRVNLEQAETEEQIAIIGDVIGQMDEATKTELRQPFLDARKRVKQAIEQNALVENQ